MFEYFTWFSASVVWSDSSDNMRPEQVCMEINSHLPSTNLHPPIRRTRHVRSWPNLTLIALTCYGHEFDKNRQRFLTEYHEKCAGCVFYLKSFHDHDLTRAEAESNWVRSQLSGARLTSCSSVQWLKWVPIVGDDISKYHTGVAHSGTLASWPGENIIGRLSHIETQSQ